MSERVLSGTWRNTLRLLDRRLYPIVASFDGTAAAPLKKAGGGLSTLSVKLSASTEGKARTGCAPQQSGVDGSLDCRLARRPPAQTDYAITPLLSFHVPGTEVDFPPKLASPT